MLESLKDKVMNWYKPSFNIFEGMLNEYDVPVEKLKEEYAKRIDQLIPERSRKMFIEGFEHYYASPSDSYDISGAFKIDTGKRSNEFFKTYLSGQSNASNADMFIFSKGNDYIVQVHGNPLTGQAAFGSDLYDFDDFATYLQTNGLISTKAENIWISNCYGGLQNDTTSLFGANVRSIHNSRKPEAYGYFDESIIGQNYENSYEFNYNLLNTKTHSRYYDALIGLEGDSELNPDFIRNELNNPSAWKLRAMPGDKKYERIKPNEQYLDDLLPGATPSKPFGVVEDFLDEIERSGSELNSRANDIIKNEILTHYDDGTDFVSELVQNKNGKFSFSLGEDFSKELQLEDAYGGIVGDSPNALITQKFLETTGLNKNIKVGISKTGTFSINDNKFGRIDVSLSDNLKIFEGSASDFADGIGKYKDLGYDLLKNKDTGAFMLLNRNAIESMDFVSQNKSMRSATIWSRKNGIERGFFSETVKEDILNGYLNKELKLSQNFKFRQKSHNVKEDHINSYINSFFKEVEDVDTSNVIESYNEVDKNGPNNISNATEEAADNIAPETSKAHKGYYQVDPEGNATYVDPDKFTLKQNSSLKEIANEIGNKERAIDVDKADEIVKETAEETVDEATKDATEEAAEGLSTKELTGAGEAAIKDGAKTAADATASAGTASAKASSVSASGSGGGGGGGSNWLKIGLIAAGALTVGAIIKNSRDNKQQNNIRQSNNQRMTASYAGSNDRYGVYDPNAQALAREVTRYKYGRSGEWQRIRN